MKSRWKWLTMAAVKRGYTSRTTNASNEKGNMGKSQNRAVVPCKHLMVTPCLENTVHRLADNEKKASHATPASAMNRCRSGVLALESNNYPPWLLYRKERKKRPSSATNSGVFTAPQDPVTYLQLCRPIVPRVRTVHSEYRTYKPYLYKPKMDEAVTCPKGDAALVVYGVPFGKSVPCEKSLQQGIERVHLHVYLPCEQQSDRESTRSQPDEEEAYSKLNNLSLQEGKHSEVL